MKTRSHGSPLLVRPNAIPAHLDARKLDSPSHAWPSPLPIHLDSRNLDSPLPWHNAMPGYFENRNLDSPCNFCYSPVGARSLCSSPVPPSFMDFDPLTSMAAGIFPHSSNSFFPYMNPSSHGMFSQSSAFSPLSMSKNSLAPPKASPPSSSHSHKPRTFDTPPVVIVDSAPHSAHPKSLSAEAFPRARSTPLEKSNQHDNKITELLVSAVLPLDEHQAAKDGYVHCLIWSQTFLFLRLEALIDLCMVWWWTESHQHFTLLLIITI